MSRGLVVHTGNQLETLADDLAALLATSPPDPLRREVVVVQSQGMQRWVTLRLAERLGLCMQVVFPFPRAFLEESLHALLPGEANAPAATIEAMTWRLQTLLPAFLPQPAFEPLRHYLSDGDPLKAYQLAARIARLFDQYLTYRPAMLLEWENPALPLPQGDALWQALLWRTLHPEGIFHLGSALERLAAPETPNAPAPLAEALLERVTLFGLSSLPPSQMALFFHLAASRPVHLFLLAPTPEYHGDDLTPRQRARRGLPPQTPEGNPLLTSLGRLHAHFIEVLLEADERAGHRIIDEPEHFAPPPDDSLLHRLQREIYLARHPATLPEVDEPPLPPDDPSVQLHLCHSPMREVEVLYDQLLALLDPAHGGLPGLTPGDILVMAPDIELYAPLIHAVFGYPEDPTLRLPFSIADRHPRSDNPAIDFFLRLLELPRLRCTAPELFDLLQSEPMRHRFQFGEGDLDRIRLWVEASGIRWGVDADHREQLGLPAFEENSWRAGLERLLLGYAMPGGNRTMFEGILPLDEVDGSSAELLGRLLSALEALFTTLDALQTPRPPAEWPPILEAILERFLADPPPDQVEATRAVRQSVRQFARDTRGSADAFPETPAPPIPCEVIHEHFSTLLGESESRGRFLSGGITFCALKPMRSIPARVIWLLGMNDGAFPRRPVTSRFDLIAQRWRPGDRSPRDDDRYIFLEALLAARDRLVLSCVGRSIRDHQPIPPSIVVSELLDYLDQTGWLPDGTRDLVREHPLQAFHPRYFEPDGPLWSYSRANAFAATATLRPRAIAAPPFAPQPLEMPPAAHLPFDHLQRFLRLPAAWFLLQRLGLDLSERDPSLPESEPLEPDALQDYQLTQELLEAHLRDQPTPSLAACRARALLPPGPLGERRLALLDQRARALQRRLRALLGTDPQPQAPFALHLALENGITLTGTLGPIDHGRLILFRPAKLKARDRLAAWVGHLVRSLLPAPLPTWLLGDDAAVSFEVPEPEQARRWLNELTTLYQEGEPLPFFPESSLAFATATLTPSARSRKTPLEAAAAKWITSSMGASEGDHPACRLCFGESDPISDPRFANLALQIYEPLLAHQQPLTEEDDAPL